MGSRRRRKARQTKSKARIQRYEELVQKSQEKGPTTAQIIIPIAERLGANVIEFDNLKKGYEDKLLIDGLSFKLPPGGIVGVIGPNGAGKTTLFPHDHRPGDSGRRYDHHRRDGAARLCRSVA